jgi:uncharacterized membrane protein
MAGRGEGRARHRFAYAITGLLLSASVICAALIGLRMVYSQSIQYWFLLWNLTLAWIPFLIAGVAYFMARERRAVLTALVVPAALVWLVFFPNAPYILTDFLHLGSMGDAVPGWYDVLMLFWFAWTGLLLGVVSLYLMQEIVARSSGHLIGWTFVVAAAGLGSFGIYLGRFLRWNSWDILRRPRPLAAEIYGTVTDPAAQPQVLSFTALFALLFLFVYVAMYIFARLAMPADTSWYTPDHDSGQHPQAH